MPKILLVEDNEMNRDMLSRRLQRRGYEIIQAEDGVDGIEQAEQALPDLILLDMSLPRMDGWEAAQRLKLGEATAKIPVLGLSSHAMPGDRDRAIAAGCDEYDTKPVDLDRLLMKIETLLNLRGHA